PALDPPCPAAPRPPDSSHLPRRAWLTALAAAAIWALAPSSARGQSGPELASPPVELHQYHGSPFADRFFRLDTPAVERAWRVHVSLEVDYAARPLVATPATPAISRLGQSTFALVRHAVGASAAISLGIADRLEVAAMLPVTAFQSGDTPDGVAE